MGQSEGTVTISDYAPPRRIALQGKMGKMAPTLICSVELQGEGSCFTRRVEMEPPGMMRLMAPFMGGMFRKQNAGFVANLKRVLKAQWRVSIRTRGKRTRRCGSELTRRSGHHLVTMRRANQRHSLSMDDSRKCSLRSRNAQSAGRVFGRQRSHNPLVVGSSPAGPTKQRRRGAVETHTDDSQSGTENAGRGSTALVYNSKTRLAVEERPEPGALSG